MLAEIDEKIKKVERAFSRIGYFAENVSAEDFCHHMTGEIFSEDRTTLRDVLDSESLVVYTNWWR